MKVARCVLRGLLLSNEEWLLDFTSTDFIAFLKQYDIKASMDGKGRWMDNVFIERLWRSVKYEDVYLKEYRTVVALKQGLGLYFRFYNHERPHQSFDSCTPAEVYSGLYKMAALRTAYGYVDASCGPASALRDVWSSHG